MEPRLTVGVLVRISDDRLGDERGVARQEADCRRLADQRGWKVGEVYVENDTSAYRRRSVKLHDGSTALRVFRPEYRRLLNDLVTGHMQGLVAYDLDRVARDPRDLEDLIDVVEAGERPTASVTGSLDLSTDAGVFMARMMVNVANKSSRDTARRVRRKLAENAELGRHHGGSRPYGWEDDRQALRADEADTVRLATAMLLAGNSVKAIVRRLNHDERRNSLGAPWRDVTLRSMLVRPRNAGLRLHHGEVVGVGQWTPILDRDTWDQVRVILTDPARTTNPGAASRRHLLTGIARCGVCENVMRVGKGKPYKGVVSDVYRCKARSCVSRDQARVDSLVQRVVCDRLAQPDAVALLASDDREETQAARREVERLRGRLDVAAADYADDRIDGEQLRTITARLRPQLEAAQRAVPAVPRRLSALDGLIGQPDVTARWEALDVSVHRQIVDLLLSIKINKTRRGPGFDENSIEMEWK